MAVPYNHREIEQKWRKIWEEHPVNVNDGKKPKYYCLVSVSVRKWSACRTLERIRYLRCLEQIQNAQWILSDSSDGMGCIRTSG